MDRPRTESGWAQATIGEASTAGADKNSLTAPSRGPMRANTSSNNSIASSDYAPDGSTSMRSSIDGALDKLYRRSSEDVGQGEDSTRRRMSRLFKSRRHRRKSAAQDDRSQLGDTTDHVPPLPVVGNSMDRFQSEESLGLHKSVASSLVTEDSDTEAAPVLAPAPTRPSISPHQSHAGYLTLSSPLITSETLDSASSAATAVESATSARESSGPTHAKSLEVGSSIKRSPSPIGKLKEAFTPQRKATSPKAGAEPDSSRPNTSGGGLGALFGGAGKSLRGSKGLEQSGLLYTSPTQIHDSAETQSTPSLPSSAPKRIITTLPATPPNLVESPATPTTLITPPTPTDARPPSPATSTSSAKANPKHSTTQSNPNIIVSPSGGMISHRRVRSATNPPSKLSSSISAPLSPTAEEAKTPGGTFVTQSPGGFFSSVFSAAQNAANTLSTTIANTTSGTKSKGPNSQLSEETKIGGTGDEEVIGPENANLPADNAGTEKRRLAVETLGSGNLSLAQLGISDHSSEPSPMSSAVNLATDEASAKAEDMAAAEAVTAAYATDNSEQPHSDSRPRSMTNPSDVGSPSPRKPFETDSPSTSVQRTGSIRSKISAGRKRRHRGSSATTGNTIAAAINASTATLAPQLSQTNGNRLNGTGFAVAAPKRNRDFHSLFKSVPEDDYLIEDYSAALQKEILLQGRLYVSEGHLCFSSNILGWVTNLVISFDEVVSVEKKSTAVVFPNAIVIQTLHARNVFASLLSRDSTYDLIIGIWKISHPNLKSSLNGVTLDGSGTGDKTEKAESVASDGVSSEDSDDEVYDEDAEEEEGLGSFTENGEGSIAGSEQDSVKTEARKVSAAVAAAVGSGTSKPPDGMDAAISNAAAPDFPGPATHAPTDCGDTDMHYEKLLIDTTIPAPLGKVYSLTFGPASGVFMRKWLIEDQKSTDLQMEDDKKGLGEENKTLSFSYTKPLGGAIGPKQTRCNITTTLEQFDLDKAVTVLCATQTPDVPSGNVFVTKTRYCLMWGAGNSTRLVMTFVVEWSGKSWLKGPIEKGANDGQISYATALTAALRASVAAKATRPAKAGRNKKRSKTQTLDDLTPALTGPTSSTANKVQEKNWGMLDPLRSLLGPLADPLEILFSTQVMIPILLTTIMYLYFFRSPSVTGTSLSPHHLSTPQRLAAYDEIWRTEENELWKWLDERVGLERSTGMGREKVRRDFGKKLETGSGAMSEREMDEAIRVTEERLGGLKEAVRLKREKGSR